MSMLKGRAIGPRFDFEEEQRQVQEIVRKKNFFLHLAYTKEKQLILPFSRRSIGLVLDQLIDEHDPTLVIRCAQIDLRVDFSDRYPHKKIIRLIDERMETIHDVRRYLRLKTNTYGACVGLSPTEKRRERRRRQRQRQRQRHLQEEDNSALRSILKEHAFLREKSYQQQIVLDELKEKVEQLYALPGKIYDHLDQIASGFGAIQNRLGEIHLERPEGGLRYRGL
ncbi:unnamed protein product [Adineta ricciae]|uniref:Uncharacterized protein n=1 Tax=Adineta ricciae TaxID=249248 RepID=A0A815WTH8_ADIRI|nr:unnamed protein product [Adineta ricciae]